MGSFSGITFSSASTEVGDARNLAERSEHTSGQRHLGVLGSWSDSWALAPSLGLLVSQFLNRTRTRSSGTSSRSSGSSRSSSSRSSSSRSSSSRSSFCVCNKQRQHATHQERPAQSNVHARPRDARVESAQVNRPRACMRLPVARHLCWQAAHRPMSRQPCTCTCACRCAAHAAARLASVARRVRM